MKATSILCLVKSWTEGQQKEWDKVIGQDSTLISKVNQDLTSIPLTEALQFCRTCEIKYWSTIDRSGYKKQRSLKQNKSTPIILRHLWGHWSHPYCVRICGGINWLSARTEILNHIFKKQFKNTQRFLLIVNSMKACCVLAPD